MRKRAFVLALGVIFFTVQSYGQGSAGNAENNAGKTPPMGWNSWNHFKKNISAGVIQAIAGGAAKNKLDEAGYRYLVIDDGWQADTLGVDGALIPAKDKFPEGIAPFAAYVGERGFELGIYSSPNLLTCGGAPGTLGREQLHAKQFAEWGCRFVKYDYCPTRNNETELPASIIIERYRAFAAAVRAQDSDIVLAICEKRWAGGLNRRQRATDAPKITQEQRRRAFEWCPEAGVMWRTTWDIGPRWDRIMEILDEQEGLAPLCGPNAFNDPDMLEVGNGNLTEAENRAHFSLWCMLNAPLMLGNDLRDIPGAVLEIITNKEVIDLNQDLLCRQAEKVVDEGDIEIFSKPLTNGDIGVCVLNRGESGKTIAVRWQELGLSMETPCKVRELWTKQNLGKFKGKFDIIVNSHDVAVFRLARTAN